MPVVCEKCQGVPGLPGACYCAETARAALNQKQLERLKSWARRFRDHMNTLARNEAKTFTVRIQSLEQKVTTLRSQLHDANAAATAFRKRAELILPAHQQVKTAIAAIRDKDDIILSEDDEAALCTYCSMLVLPEKLLQYPTETQRLDALSKSPAWLSRMRGSKRYSEILAKQYRASAAEGTLISAANMQSIAAHPTHKSSVAAHKVLAQGAGLLSDTKTINYTGEVKHSIEGLLRRYQDAPALPAIDAPSEPADAPQ